MPRGAVLFCGRARASSYGLTRAPPREPSRSFKRRRAGSGGRGDVAIEDDVERMWVQQAEALRALHVLYNNAGVLGDKYPTLL